MAPAAAKNKSGSETRQRDRLLNIRVSAEEQAMIRQAAEKEGIGMATLLRRALMRELHPA